MRNPTYFEKLNLANAVLGRSACDVLAAWNSLHENYKKIRGEFFEAVKRELKITGPSVWVVLGVENFNDVPYPDATVIVYDGATGWGQHHEERIPRNSTWAHIWRVSDRLIERSGDVDHVFIESFQCDGKYLHINCGS